jgi:hypothetical protein
MLFGKRKRFNGDVDLRLREFFGIDASGGGLLGLLSLLDTAWSARMNADEAATYVAVLTCVGHYRECEPRKGSLMLERILAYGKTRVAVGQIGRQHWDRWMLAIAEESKARHGFTFPQAGLDP